MFLSSSVCLAAPASSSKPTKPSKSSNASGKARGGGVQTPARVAQNSVRMSDPVGVVRETYRRSVDAPVVTGVQGEVTFEVQSYATEVPGQPKLSRSALMSANLKYEGGRGDWGGKVDATFGRYMDLNYSVFSVKEVYGAYATSGGGRSFSVALGRKDEFWSEVDQNWDLGLWEPRYLEEPLRPVDQGIAGLIAHFKHETGFEVAAYVSPIFIPTMSPQLAEKNGDLVSESRWTRPPSSSTELMGTPTKLVYNLEIPAVTKLIANPGAGARVSFGRANEEGPWISANFARKPVNSLSIQYDYKLAVSQQADADAPVTVSPAVSYHRVWGADFGWNFGDGRASLSYLEDAPEDQRPEDELGSDGMPRTEWIRQNPSAIQAYGAHLEWRWQGLLADPVGVKLDYLSAKTSDTRDVNSRGEDKGALIPNRLFFTNAAQMRLTFPLRVAGRPLILGTRYLREFDQKGSIYTLEAKLYPTRSFAVHAGVDILGTDDGSESNQDTRFLNQFRTNDRVFGGVSYVF